MNKHIYLPILCLLALAMSSCATKKQTLPYFENMQEASGVMGSSTYEVKIVPDDELLITVNSTDPRATAEYNLPLANPAINNRYSSGANDLKTISQASQYQTFLVDKQGDITFPKLGKVHVAGMTLEQVRNYLTGRISEEVKDPLVHVSLLNFKVNVIGEVKNPMTVIVKSERFSILDALAGAGDMTEYGNRENVLVIRERPDGTKEYVRLNMQDPNIVNSPYFYLRQNDVVYVEPNKIRNSISKYDQNKSYRVQVISTVVSALSVVATLVISLTLNK